MATTGKPAAVEMENLLQTNNDRDVESGDKHQQDRKCCKACPSDRHNKNQKCCKACPSDCHYKNPIKQECCKDCLPECCKKCHWECCKACPSDCHNKNPNKQECCKDCPPECCKKCRKCKQPNREDTTPKGWKRCLPKCCEKLPPWAIIVLACVVVGVVVGVPVGVKLSAPPDPEGFEKVLLGEKGAVAWIMLVNDTKENWYYNFNDSIEACRKLGAELWDVRGGEGEWRVFLETVKANHSKELKFGIWINGRTMEDCTDLDEVCEKKAAEGQGLPVVWPDNRPSTYSRLADKNGDDECIKFNDKEDLWKSTSCTNGNWAMCVVRRG